MKGTESTKWKQQVGLPNPFVTFVSFVFKKKKTNYALCRNYYDWN